MNRGRPARPEMERRQESEDTRLVNFDEDLSFFINQVHGPDHPKQDFLVRERKSRFEAKSTPIVIADETEPVEAESSKDIVVIDSDVAEDDTGIVEEGEFLDEGEFAESNFSRLVEWEFINVVNVAKALPSVVKHIDDLVNSIGASIQTYCTSEQCNTLVLSRGVVSERVTVLKKSSQPFKQFDVIVLATLMDAQCPSIETWNLLAQSAGSSFYVIGSFGLLQGNENWSRPCRWFLDHDRLCSTIPLASK